MKCTLKPRRKHATGSFKSEHQSMGLMNWNARDDVTRIKDACFSSTALTAGVTCMNRVTNYARQLQPGQHSQNKVFKEVKTL